MSNAPLPTSLRGRIGLFTGLLVTVFWLGAAVVTGKLLLHEVNEVFDRDLRAAAERILPIVLHERHDEGDLEDASELFEQRSRALDARGARTDDVEFVVFSERDGVILRSRAAETLHFPTEEGFASDGQWRYFLMRGDHGHVSIAVARPLEARKEIANTTMATLLLPLLLVIPLVLWGIYVFVGRGLRPVSQLEEELGQRGPTNLAPIASDQMPRELKPMVESSNRLLSRVAEGFEAERSFAANAAHEMRTPLAGAIAQAQRLQVESTDAEAVTRAGEIEATLKRLNSYGEKLMQLARAEGARLRGDSESDLRPVVRIVMDDFRRSLGRDLFEIDLPDSPVMSDLDPDALGIVLRNLVENALRHGAQDAAIQVRLSNTISGHLLTVGNAGPALTPEELAHLSQRFSRGNGAGDGTGLGLSIIHIIAERAEAQFELVSPRPDQADGVEGRLRF